jgi:hypothetical protein
MTKQEYQNRLKELEEKFEKDKKQLAQDFVFSNLKYKVGDIVVTDNVSSIKVDDIKCGYGLFSVPHVSYWGYELKKDLTPRKDKSRRSIWIKIED